MSDLQLYINDLKTEAEFETQSGKLIFHILETDYHNRTNFNEKFTISNTDLIRKFCVMLQDEMRQKVTSLEIELLSA